MSRMVFMSMPCPVPKAIASLVAASAVADRKLLSTLHGLALARLRPDVERLAHQAHQRLEALVACSRAGQHDGDRRLVGAGGSAGHRRVDELDAGLASKMAARPPPP